MAWTYTLDCATPAGSADPKEGDDRIRELKSALQERLAVDHVFALTSTQVSGIDTGKHNKITMPEVAAPTPVEDYGHLYAMNVSGVTELFWVGGTGTPKQLTSGGKINLATADLALACLLAGNQTVAGIKTFSSIPVLPDASPTTDHQAARKKYVDDQISAAHPQVNSATGTTDISINSATLTAMADMTYTDTFAAGNVFVTFNATIRPSQDDTIAFVLYLDGVEKMRVATYHSAASNDIEPIMLAWSGAVTAASHTILIKWSDSAGTVYQDGTTYPRNLTIIRNLL